MLQFPWKLRQSMKITLILIILLNFGTNLGLIDGTERSNQRDKSDHWHGWRCPNPEIQLHYWSRSHFNIITMSRNIYSQYEGNHNEITHSNIATMLAEEDYLTETPIIQIFSCHRSASTCFTEPDILKKFCEAKHLL